MNSFVKKNFEMFPLIIAVTAPARTALAPVTMKFPIGKYMVRWLGYVGRWFNTKTINVELEIETDQFELIRKCVIGNPALKFVGTYMNTDAGVYTVADVPSLNPTVKWTYNKLQDSDNVLSRIVQGIVEIQGNHNVTKIARPAQFQIEGPINRMESYNGTVRLDSGTRLFYIAIIFFEKRPSINSTTSAEDLAQIICSANLGLNTYRPPDDASFDVTISYKNKTWISKNLSFQNGGSSHIKSSISEIKRRRPKVRDGDYIMERDFFLQYPHLVFNKNYCLSDILDYTGDEENNTDINFTIDIKGSTDWNPNVSMRFLAVQRSFAVRTSISDEFIYVKNTNITTNRFTVAGINWVQQVRGNIARKLNVIIGN